MHTLSLFSGIGGLDLAVEEVFGAEVVIQCEKDPFCQKVLKVRWPKVAALVSDVHSLVGHYPVDIICGGFPCTDLSTAGKMEGLTGARSGLWFEYLRIIQHVRPRIVVIENVPGLLRKAEWREQVLGPLQQMGYAVEHTLVKASDVGAPHRRERAFILAVWPGTKLPTPHWIGHRQAISVWPTPVASEVRQGYQRRTPGNKSQQRSLTTQVIDEWPTPVASDAIQGSSGEGRQGSPNLGTRVKNTWPTPVVSDSFGGGGRCNTKGTGKPGVTLSDAMRPDRLPDTGRWASPAARDYRSGAGRQANGHTPQLPEQVHGVLNPVWVEALMGLPANWTDPTRGVLPWVAWPAGPGPQHQWEPPRTLPPRSLVDRAPRMRALGNAVVPQQAVLALSRLIQQHKEKGNEVRRLQHRDP